MSADRWSSCPKCKKIADDKQKETLDEIRQQYGKMPFDEFVKAQAKVIDSVVKTKTGETLREDYEIYSLDGKLHISYYCSCDKCGFSFGHEQHVDMMSEADGANSQ